jgi:hypothetical protein
MRKRFLRAVVSLTVALILCLPGVAGAVVAPNETGAASPGTQFADPPIAVDAPEWTPFNWGSDGRNIEGPFTFSSPKPTLVRITDVACRGDRFQVFDFGTSIGTTPAVPADQVGECDPYITDPDIAFQDPSYTQGSFGLSPGSHSITIVAITNPFDAGTGFIRVDSAPLPTSKDQCMNGGWQQYAFKNQGQCVAFVNRGA